MMIPSIEQSGQIQKSFFSGSASLLMVCLALILGTLLTTFLNPSPYEEDDQGIEKLDSNAELKTLADNREGLIIVLLDYAVDYELNSKAHIAIEKYGLPARDVIERFGGTEEFKKILREYGERVIPVIDYYVKSDDLVQQMRHAVSKAIKNLGDGVKGIFKQDERLKMPDEYSEIYGPDYKGAYAINRIRLGGLKFLDEFTLNSQHVVVRKKGQMLVNFVTDSAFGGLLNAEKDRAETGSWHLDKMAWAAADVAIIARAAMAWRTARTLRVPILKKNPPVAPRKLSQAYQPNAVRTTVGTVSAGLKKWLAPINQIFLKPVGDSAKNFARSLAWLLWTLVSLILVGIGQGIWLLLYRRRQRATAA